MLLLLLSSVALLLCFSPDCTLALPAIPQQQNNLVANELQRLYLENPAQFQPIMAKRRSAEFINGLLSLERLNAMGKRSMPPSLLWDVVRRR